MHPCHTTPFRLAWLVGGSSSVLGSKTSSQQIKGIRDRLATLSTAVLHGLDSSGKQHGKLDEAADKHGCDGHQGAPLVGSLKQAADATFDAQEGVSGECQSEERGDCGLHAEVDGEQFALDGGEGWPVDRAEHDDAIDEGLQ